jgi:hypothetical protein
MHKLNSRNYKLFIIGMLIFVAGLVFSSCSTSGKTGKRKNCDCPRWSYNTMETRQSTIEDEKL